MSKNTSKMPRLKRALALLLIVAAAGTVGFSQASTDPEKILMNSAAQTMAPKQGGLMLDTARHFYPVSVIKDFIDTIARSGGNFLHLHFSDHENYALESKILNQRAADAKRNADGVYINPLTNKPFLSFEQLEEIKAYAKSKNIELIPEVDSPNHMTTIFTLLEAHRGKDFVNAIKSRYSDEEINITNPESIAFMKSLIGEVADAFGNSSSHFHIGGDEFGYSVDSNHEFIAYANELAAFLKQKGLTTRIWNDGIIKVTVDKLNHEIQVTYWSYDGDVENKQTAQERRRIRVSMPELIDRGFNVLNYNSYYLYVNPKQDWGTSYNSDFATRDIINRWSLGVWDGENQKNAIKDTSKIMGAALAIWGENAGSMSSKTIQKYTSGLLESIIRKTRSESDSGDKLMQNLAVLSGNSLKQSYVDWSLIQDGEALNLQDNGTESLHLLQEQALQKRKNLNVWVRGAENNKVVLNGHWQKTEDIAEKEGVNYRAYKYLDNTLWIDKKVPIELFAG